MKFGILDNLCSDVILGYEFQKLHKQVIFPNGGTKKDLVVQPIDITCAVAASQLTIPLLFSSVPDGAKPVAASFQF